MSINIITVSGVVNKSPTSTISSGTLYINFELLVNTSNTTQHYAVSASSKNAESILNSVNAGDTLFIIGRPSVDTYMKKDKQVVAVQKIWISKFELCNQSSSNNEMEDDPLTVDNFSPSNGL